MMIWQDGIGEQNWNANSIALRTHAEITAWVASLPDGPKPPDRVTEWGFWANDHQKAPEGDWHSWLFLGGRGAGKTRAGAEWLAALAQRGVRCALIGASLHDVREVMIEGPSGLKNVASKGNRPSYEVSRKRLRWPNGGVAYAYSAEDPESLRGPQFHYAWADEFCAWRHPAETLAMLRMGLRLGEKPQLCLTTTPKPITALRTLMKESGVEITRAATAQNAGHLAREFLQSLGGLYGGTRLAAQELEGLVVDDDNRVLWRADDLGRCYGARPERFEEVVVAVDPSTTAGGDACGIVVAGRLGERGYVLEDATVSGFSPLGWAQVVASVVAEYGAHRVIAEANQGGEMIRSPLAMARLWRTGRTGFGGVADQALDVTATWTGLALRPRAPVFGRVSGDAVSWLRSPRYGGDSWETEPPLCEDYELYRVQVFDGEMLVRTVEVSAPGWVYAERVTDFPSGFGVGARVEIEQKSQVYGYGPVLRLALG